MFGIFTERAKRQAAEATLRIALHNQEAAMMQTMNKELWILRPDFGLARLIDWDKTAMDTVEGRE